MTFKFIKSEQAENWTFTKTTCTVYLLFNFSKPLLLLPRHRATLDDWWQSVGQVLVCKNGWSRSRQNAPTRHMWDGNGGLFIAEHYNYLQWHIAIHFSRRSKHPFTQKVHIYLCTVIFNGESTIQILEILFTCKEANVIHFSRRSKHPFPQKVHTYIMERVQPEIFEMCLAAKKPL